MLTAITRSVSPALNQCELGYLPRVAIDIFKAGEQHRQYEECLRSLGARVISLPAEPEYPDSMFVEDPAVVVKEVAVMTRMGAESRRGESESLARALAPFRPLRRLREPATLEGGDVMRIGTTLFVGRSQRTNDWGIAQLRHELAPFGYTVQPVDIHGCLHLKSGACPLPDGSILANRNWVDAGAFGSLRVLDLPAEEPRAANVLAIGDTVLVPQCFPATARLLACLGWKLRKLDISELMKAEAGLTCSSVLFDAETPA